MKKITIFVALLIILGGCTSWHNNNITDPDKADEKYEKDTKFCTHRTEQQHPIAPKNDNGARMLTTHRANFSENYSATRTYNNCMRSRGWVKK